MFLGGEIRSPMVFRDLPQTRKLKKISSFFSYLTLFPATVMMCIYLMRLFAALFNTHWAILPKRLEGNWAVNWEVNGIKSGSAFKLHLVFRSEIDWKKRTFKETMKNGTKNISHSIITIDFRYKMRLQMPKLFDFDLCKSIWTPFSRTNRKMAGNDTHMKTWFIRKKKSLKGHNVQYRQSLFKEPLWNQSVQCAMHWKNLLEA